MSSTPSNRLGAAKHRQSLVREAARILAQGQSPDYQSAKRKALKNLGLPMHTSLPRNQDVEAALCEHQRLFGGAKAHEQLSRLRFSALNAMHELKTFKPRLTGPVLRGSADQGSVVCLHLFAEMWVSFSWIAGSRFDISNSDMILAQAVDTAFQVLGLWLMEWSLNSGFSAVPIVIAGPGVPSKVAPCAVLRKMKYGLCWRQGVEGSWAN